ncbi:MAG: bifunctional folylpolyglutamate synthase/dihydrofolate synthase [Deltaproteobacteria bacterium]|nr:bifunctional folylpolyglutamate synthase/dihydrofolate synthase [Deltaproteobacteria bacterium]
MPSSKKTLEYLYGLERLGIKKGLGRIIALARALDSPHLSLPCVHVAGTNGKGSTAAMLASILTEAGYKTGLYTSPHLIKFNERIQVDGKPVGDKDLARYVVKIKKTIEKSGRFAARPTFFEFTTAAAFLHFAAKKTDIAVIETGMGGRWDATNIISPLVSVITNVALDHTEILGSTLEKIALEKAGIIKRGAPVVTAEDKPEALAAIIKAAKEKWAPVYRLGREFNVKAIKRKADSSLRSEGRRGAFDYRGISFGLKGLKTPLLGPHQAKNAACALAAIELLREKGWNIPDAAIWAGLKNVRWPCRVEVLRKRPLVIVDAAHNPAGAATLKAALQGFRFEKLTLALGILADKDIEGILRELAPLAHTLILTAPQNSRGATTGTLLKMTDAAPVRLMLISSVARACAVALEGAGTEDAVCVAGSVYTAGEAKAYFAQRHFPTRKFVHAINP